MQTTKIALWVNRRSDLGNKTPLTAGTRSTLVDAAVGEWPKKWKSIKTGDLIGRKVDQVPVTTEVVNNICTWSIKTDTELQQVIANITDPATGEFYSFEYLGKLGKLLWQAKKKGAALHIILVQTTVQSLL